MACSWSTRWSWPTASLSGRSIFLQMSSVRMIRQNERDYGMDRQWHKLTPLSTANKAHCSEQIAIMKGRLNELMMMDELRGRDEENRMPMYLLNELFLHPQCLCPLTLCLFSPKLILDFFFFFPVRSTFLCLHFVNLSLTPLLTSLLLMCLLLNYFTSIINFFIFLLTHPTFVLRNFGDRHHVSGHLHVSVPPLLLLCM